MKKRKNWFLLGIYVLVVIINVLSRYSRGFGNRVRRSVFYMTQSVSFFAGRIFTDSGSDTGGGSACSGCGVVIGMGGGRSEGRRGNCGRRP